MQGVVNLIRCESCWIGYKWIHMKVSGPIRSGEGSGAKKLARHAQ
jgi:hypothetical protein